MFIWLKVYTISAILLPELSGGNDSWFASGKSVALGMVTSNWRIYNYYMKFCPQINGNPHGIYKIIGQKMIAGYPSIKREGLHPWVRFHSIIPMLHVWKILCFRNIFYMYVIRSCLSIYDCLQPALWYTQIC